MGTKLSKTDNKQQVKDDLQEPTPEEKSMTLPASPKTSKTEEDVVEEEANTTAKSETLPRSSLDRTSSFSNRLRKSMRKMVGRKKVKESKKEETEEAENQDTNTNEQIEEDKEDFKTVQQKARADFFKDMIPENSNSTDKDDTEKEAEKEEKITENNDAAEETVNVSLIGSPVPEESEKTSTDEVTEKEETTEQPEKEETKQVSAVIQDKQEVGKESYDVAEHDATNDLEDVQDETTAEEEKSEEVSENKDESKEVEPVTNEEKVDEASADETEEQSSNQENSENSSVNNMENVDENDDDEADENMSASGSESIESKQDDTESDSEEVTTDEGIVGSDDDVESEKDIKEKHKSDNNEISNCEVDTGLEGDA